MTDLLRKVKSFTAAERATVQAFAQLERQSRMRIEESMCLLELTAPLVIADRAASPPETLRRQQFAPVIGPRDHLSWRNAPH